MFHIVNHMCNYYVHVYIYIHMHHIYIYTYILLLLLLLLYTCINILLTLFIHLFIHSLIHISYTLPSPCYTLNLGIAGGLGTATEKVVVAPGDLTLCEVENHHV